MDDTIHFGTGSGHGLGAEQSPLRSVKHHQSAPRLKAGFHAPPYRPTEAQKQAAYAAQRRRHSATVGLKPMER